MSAKGRARGRAAAVDAAAGTPLLFDVGEGAVEAPDAETGDEFYPTPPSAILPILETDLISLPGGVWIEPCAGTGQIVTTVNAFRDDVRWILVEKDEAFRSHLELLVRPGVDVLLPFGDFIHRDWPCPVADVMLFNPPFSHALEFVVAGFARARRLVMLQRTGWLAKKRAPWLRQHQPDLYTLAKRPSFTRNKKTDSAEYGWFDWPEDGRNRRVGRIAMLDLARGGQVDLLTP